MNRKEVIVHLVKISKLPKSYEDKELEDILHILRDTLSSYQFDRCISAVSDYLLQALREKDGHK